MNASEIKEAVKPILVMLTPVTLGDSTCITGMKASIFC